MLPRQTQHLSVKEIEGQTVILDREHGKLHELNQSASYIWQLCDGHTPVSEIVSAMARAYDRLPTDVERDVTNALQQLEALRLIEWSSPVE